MAMTHSSLLRQYLASVKAIDTFREMNSDGPHPEIDMLTRTSIEATTMLKAEIVKRGLPVPEIPKE